MSTIATMHGNGEHMEAQPPMGLKGDSCVIISGSEQGQGTHVKEA